MMHGTVRGMIVHITEVRSEAQLRALLEEKAQMSLGAFTVEGAMRSNGSPLARKVTIQVDLSPVKAAVYTTMLDWNGEQLAKRWRDTYPLKEWIDAVVDLLYLWDGFRDYTWS